MEYFQQTFSTRGCRSWSGAENILVSYPLFYDILNDRIDYASHFDTLKSSTLLSRVTGNVALFRRSESDSLCSNWWSHCIDNSRCSICNLTETRQSNHLNVEEKRFKLTEDIDLALRNVLRSEGTNVHLYRSIGFVGVFAVHLFCIQSVFLRHTIYCWRFGYVHVGRKFSVTILLSFAIWQNRIDVINLFISIFYGIQSRNQFRQSWWRL